MSGSRSQAGRMAVDAAAATRPQAAVRPQTQTTTQRAALLGVLLVAFVLATLRLGAQSLWYDEGVTAMVARLPARELAAWTAADIQPPLYYLGVRAVGQLIGWSEWALRWLSAAAATVAVALIARLAHALRDTSRTPAAEGGRTPLHEHAGQGAWAPLWAAALLALHPLLIYYAQEARMYTLLLALCLAAGVAIAPALQGAMGWGRWLRYALWATLALYTHYFAGFVLAALALAWLWPGARALDAQARRAQAARSAAAHGLAALAFAPWAVVMLRRLQDDTSYWQGRLKLGEALAETAARFVGGETLPEAAALAPALAVLTLTVAGAILLWRRAPHRRTALRVGALWLLVPVAGVLVLAWFTPKFNVRYVFAALPGLVLIWAQLADALLSDAQSGAPAQQPRRLLWQRALGLVAIAGLLGIFVWSTSNWFTQARYAKAQWRQLTEFLRPRLQPEESVFLVSGHAWPVWEYYAPDIPATRLPAIDVLDVNHLLSFAETGAPLRAAIADAGGAWLVGWQDEVVDPDGVVPVQLELGGREKGSSARFNQLSLRRWSRIRTERIADAPPISRAIDATFGDIAGDVVTLAGLHALDNGDLLLFWQGGAGLGTRDLQVQLTVTQTDGTPVAQLPGRRPAGYTHPTFRWTPGETVMGRIAAADWLGSEPAAGAYTVTVRVYDANDPTAAPLTVKGAAVNNATGNGAGELVLHDVQAILE